MIKNIVMTVICVFILDQVPLLFSEDQAWYMTVYCNNLQSAFFAALVFHMTRKSRYNMRSFMLVYFIYYVVNAESYFLYYFFDYDTYLTSYLIFIFLAIFCFSNKQLTRYFSAQDDNEQTIRR